MDCAISETALSLQVGGGGGDIVKLPKPERDCGMEKGDFEQNDVIVVVVHTEKDGRSIEGSSDIYIFLEEPFELRKSGRKRFGRRFFASLEKL